MRSQDGKQLVNCNFFWVSKVCIYGDCNATDGDGFKIGGYSTTEEAVKALDTIEQQIEAIEYYERVGKDRHMPCPPFVFQMPEAGFSKEVADAE